MTEKMANDTQGDTRSLQDRMRRDGEGNLVCEACGGRVRWGWVFRFGSITLATCAAQRCWPDQRAGWVQGVRFRRSTPAELNRQQRPVEPPQCDHPECRAERAPERLQ